VNVMNNASAFPTQAGPHFTDPGEEGRVNLHCVSKKRLACYWL